MVYIESVLLNVYRIHISTQKRILISIPHRRHSPPPLGVQDLHQGLSGSAGCRLVDVDNMYSLTRSSRSGANCSYIALCPRHCSAHVQWSPSGK